MSELVFLFSAEADIQRAYEFYENWQEGRGVIFIGHLEAAFDYLKQFPQIGPVFHERYRRLLVLGFPYGIFYTIEGRRTIIPAVMDTRQSPEAIRERLP